MKRFFWIQLVLWFVTVQTCFAQNEERLKITHGPYIQNVTETSVTIFFTTNKQVAPGVMIKTGDEGFRKVQNSHDGLFDVQNGLQKVQVENLEPGTKYEYKLFAYEVKNFYAFENIYGDTLISEAFSFTTPEPRKEVLNFTVFCDIHADANKLGKYLDHVDIEEQDCFFLNGDMLDVHDISMLYSGFIDVCVERFASEKPFYFVRGNHDTRGKDARELKKYFDFPEDKYYYAFNRGPVRFIVLDSGEDKADSHPEYSKLADFDRYRLEQLAWLNEEVEKDEFKNASFRIVLIHMPVIKNKDNWYGMQFLADHFGPVLNNAGIDLMLSGHMHRNAWMKPGESGFNYPVMICSNNNFVEAKAERDQVSIKLKNIEGNVVDIFTIEKK